MEINFNGKIVDAEQPIINFQNRAFQYGDGVFETIRMFDGKIPFLKYHIERMRKGLDLLKFKTPKKYNASFFSKEIKKIAQGNARIKIIVFRDDGGLYTPKNNRPKFLIQSSPLKDSEFILNKKGLTIDFFEDQKLSISPLSNIKSCNSIPYILASLFKKEQNLSDCIMFNQKDRIAEGSSSNIFLLKKNKLITPSLSEGCIDGVLRKVIIDTAEEINLKIKEKKVSLNSLKNAEEIWLTNSISGIRWVSEIKNFRKITPPLIAPQIVNSINQKFNLNHLPK